MLVNNDLKEDFWLEEVLGAVGTRASKSRKYHIYIGDAAQDKDNGHEVSGISVIQWSWTPEDLRGHMLIWQALYTSIITSRSSITTLLSIFFFLTYFLTYFHQPPRTITPSDFHSRVKNLFKPFQGSSPKASAIISMRVVWIDWQTTGAVSSSSSGTPTSDKSSLFHSTKSALY